MSLRPRPLFFHRLLFLLPFLLIIPLLASGASARNFLRTECGGANLTLRCDDPNDVTHPKFFFELIISDNSVHNLTFVTGDNGGTCDPVVTNIPNSYYSIKGDFHNCSKYMVQNNHSITFGAMAKHYHENSIFRINNMAIVFNPCHNFSFDCEFIKKAESIFTLNPVCNKTCSGRGNCTVGGNGNFGNTPECSCETGFSGNDCEIDACSSDPCKSSTTRRVCSLKPANVSEFQCTCPPGSVNNVQADKCDDVNECANPGDNSCTANYNCINQNGGYKCESVNSTCNFKYQNGISCLCNPGYELSAGQSTNINTFACVDSDECLVNNGGCPNNATCTNTVGSRECSCDAGFSPPYNTTDGTGCNIDACSPNPCEKGQCERTFHAPNYYKCHCVGYSYGPRCNNFKPLLDDTFCKLAESDVRDNRTDYGETSHSCTDQCCVLKGSLAQTIKINFVNHFKVVPFFEAVACQLKMHLFGAVTLDKEPQYLNQIESIDGTVNRTLYEKESLLILWGDHDMRFDSFLKIRQFHSVSPNFTPVLAHVKELFGNEFLSSLSSDKSTWIVIAAEWDHVYPLPECNDSISFEIIIVTDGQHTVVAYNAYGVDIPYLCTDRLNRTIPLIEIGYHILSRFLSLRNPNGTEFAYHQSLENSESGHGYAGLQVFRAFSRNMSSDHLTILNWALKELKNGNGTCRNASIDNALQTCPCDVTVTASTSNNTIASEDVPAGFELPKSNETIIKTIRSQQITQQRLDGTTVVRDCTRFCEYTSVGNLNVSPQSKNFIECSGTFENDNDIYNLCLKPENQILCFTKSLFSGCRSNDLCLEGTTQVSSVFGDPHFNTLDGKSYTFNGLGDYILTEFALGGKRCVLYARTSQAINADTNIPTAATIFSGFSAECSDSVRFRILMITNGMSLEICTGTTCSPSDLFQNSITYTEFSAVANFLVKKLNSETVELQLGSDADLVLTVTYNSQRFLTPSIRINRKYEGVVRGMLGNMDKDPANDLIPNGLTVPLPDSASEETIFNSFGETWKWTGELKFAPRVVPAFTPVFSDNLDWTNHPVGLAAAQGTCGNDNACLFDVHQTASTAFGAATKTARETLEATRVADANTNPRISSSVGLRVNSRLGEVISFTITAVTTNSFNVTSRAENLPQGATYDNTTGAFRWTVVNDNAFNGLVNFVATTNPGQTTPPVEKNSLLTVTIIVCDCINGGVCNFVTTRTNSATNALLATCDCPSNWEGLRCETDLNGCARNPCKADGTGCQDVAAAEDRGVHHTCTECDPEDVLRPSSISPLFKCIKTRRCATGKWGVNCEKDCTCQRGTCDSDKGCVCPSGFSGSSCETDINECNDPTSCDSNAICSNFPGSFTCACPSGFSGSGTKCADIDECTVRNPCDVNADCLNTIGSFICTCRDPFRGNGLACRNLPINECALTPSPCVAKSTCFDLLVGFNCTCDTGYQGDGQVSCTDINECLGSPCQANAQCTNTEGSFTCTCKNGFAKNASNPGECIPSQCSPACDVNAQCKDNTTCVCLPGFEGTGLQCTNINECLKTPKPCGLNAECIDSTGSFSCVCPTMYEGDPKVRCTGIDVCQKNNPCVNSACIPTNPPLYECQCYQGFNKLGQDSCNDINECTKKTDNCDNTTTICTNIDGGFTCPCKPGYKGGVTTTSCVLVDQAVTCDNTLAKPCPKSEVANCLPEGNVNTCQCNQPFVKENEMCFSQEGVQCGFQILNRNVARASNRTATPQEVTNVLKQSYQDLSGFDDIILTSFTGGSINVEYLVKSNNPITPGEFRRVALFLRNKLNGTNNLLGNVYQIGSNSYFVRNRQNFSDIILVETLLTQKCLAFVCQNGGFCIEAAATGEPTCQCPELYEGEYCEKVKEIEEGLSDAVIAIIVVVVIIAFFLIVIAIVAIIVTIRKKEKYGTWVSGDAPVMLRGDAPGTFDPGISAFRRSQLYLGSGGGYDNFGTYESAPYGQPSDT